MSLKIPFDFIFDYLLPVDTTVKPFFGMFSIYHEEKLLLILRERDNQPEMNGIWIATNNESLENLKKQFPALRTITGPKAKTSKKPGAAWLMLPADAAEFERTAISICDLIVHRDPRIGKIP